jgi:hypothetical protein
MTVKQSIDAALLGELMDQIIQQGKRIHALEIKCGLRFADPHELDDVSMQAAHVREQYEAFDHHNPRP